VNVVISSQSLLLRAFLEVETYHIFGLHWSDEICSIRHLRGLDGRSPVTQVLKWTCVFEFEGWCPFTYIIHLSLTCALPRAPSPLSSGIVTWPWIPGLETRGTKDRRQPGAHVKSWHDHPGPALHVRMHHDGTVVGTESVPLTVPYFRLLSLGNI
jgi:hypothetical protein